jgi:hypothetical protein
MFSPNKPSHIIAQMSLAGWQWGKLVRYSEESWWGLVLLLLSNKIVEWRARKRVVVLTRGEASNEGRWWRVIIPLGGVSYAPDFYALFCVFELFNHQPKKFWAAGGQFINRTVHQQSPEMQVFLIKLCPKLLIWSFCDII